MNERKMNNRVANSVLGAILALVCIGFIAELNADEIVHKFKNPSFSGIGTGAHYLTIAVSYTHLTLPTTPYV